MTPQTPNTDTNNALGGTNGTTLNLSATTPAGTVITAPAAPSSVHTPSTFQKLMAIMAAAEPLIIAGTAPFVKNPGTQQIIVSEAPEAQALFQLFAEL